jgi:NAD(P)-dependent dehydrogenase (short-subunit alcohol dehydrogenase family)
MNDRVALVTGASAGIGHATVRALLEDGWTVVAGAREIDHRTPAGTGAHTVRLDVTDAAQREAAVAEVLTRFGRLDVLVNNAGIGPLAAIEDSSDEMWQRVFATNVFAPAALARLVLPAMRAAGQGRIVTIGSMGGQFVTPLGGVYHASKYAVEALSDALRAEARPFGIDVVLVQPGPVRTAMAESAGDVITHEGSVYRAPAAHVADSTRKALESGRGFLTADRVARTVVRACTAQQPHDRYKVGPVAHTLPALRRWLPVRAWDRLVSRQTGLDHLRVAAEAAR